MDCNYDEDLSENVFFKVLQTEFSELFDKSTSEGWIICVPRAGSIQKYALTANDFFSHILIPNDEVPETHFRTLNDKEVRICNRVVIVESDISSTYSTHILFEETYYTADMLKYKVLCLEFPLQQYSEAVKGQSGVVTVQNLRDCIDLLWTESCKEVLERMDNSIKLFLSNNDRFEFKSLQEQKDLVAGLYIRCLQAALKDPRLQEKTSMDRYLLDNVKISVESYVQHGIYQRLIQGVSACTAYEDACLNKIVRNLSDIQLRDLNIGAEFQSAIPQARSELKKLESYSTVLGKLGCLKKTIIAISNQDSAFSRTNVLAADELLPMFVFLIIKAGIPNWIAHLTYLKEFSFSSSNYHINQHSFLVTSLEAAITFIKDDLIGPAEPECQIIYDDNCEEDRKFPPEKPNGSKLLIKLFDMAKIGNLEEVMNILQKTENKSLGSLEGLNLCHPLCSCDKCEKEIGYYMCSMAPTVNSRDDRGFTVLHIASMYGQIQVVDALLNLGAKPNISDYKGSTPMHYACSRGYQNIVLMLAHAYGKIDQPDNEGNTPLHFAAVNGHESTVKAILYFAEQAGYKYDINCANGQGDTPLHSASRWGYKSIISLLLEYGASPFIENKRKLTALNLAHNLHIVDLFINSPSLSAKRVDNKSSQSFQNKSSTSSSSISSTHLDFTEEETPTSTVKKKTSGVRPITTEEIRKVERVLRAITFGDIRLACFYLGLEFTQVNPHNDCHPLCPCKNKIDVDTTFGDTFLKEEMDINVCDSDGITPLHESVRCGRTELVKLLLDSGADVNLYTRSTGMTPLHFACQNCNVVTANVLLDTGKVDINAKDKYGNTALHLAAQTNSTKLVKLLLNHNPLINIRNNTGKTPLDEAKDLSFISTVQLLMPQNVHE